MLIEVRECVKAEVSLDQAGIWAQFFGVLQTFQRVTERHDQNLSDVVYSVCELLDRISKFPYPQLITPAVKQKAKDCILFRFNKLYTPNLALAVRGDPRRGFEACAELQQLLPQQPWAEDALNCLKERVKVLPADEQQKIIRGYNKLVAHEVHFDEDELASADDMSLRTWWQTYRENGGEELRLLSQRVFERLYELRPAQSGVEELNSSCKFIQAGRQALQTANSRYLTYLYVNRRLLQEYHGAVKPAAGSFRLGCHWPPTSVSALPALDDALAEAALEKEVITLDASIAALDAADEEALRAEKAAEAGAAAKPRASPRLAQKRKAEQRAAGR